MIVKTDGSFAALVVTLLPSQSSTTFVRRGGSLSTTAHSDTARGRETSQWVLHRRNWLYYTHFKMQCIFLWGEVGESTISTITGILKVSTRFLFTTRHLFPYLHQIFTYRHQISTHLVSVAGGCASECRRPRPQVDWTGGGSVQPAPAWPLLLVPVVTGQQQFLLLVASSAEQRAEYLPATTRHPPHTASL